MSHLFHCPSGESTHLGHNSLALEASPHAVVDTLGLPPALANAVEAVTLVTLELRSALLDDRDMLLCGNHLCGCRLVKVAPGVLDGFAAGKLESKSWAARSARGLLAVDVLLRCLAVSSVSSVGRWSIRNEAGLAALALPRCANFIKCLAVALALARASRGLPDFGMPQFQHNKVNALMRCHTDNNFITFAAMQAFYQLHIADFDWYLDGRPPWAPEALSRDMHE